MNNKILQAPTKSGGKVYSKPRINGGGLAFWATGYAFAYGSDDDSTRKSFVGNSGFFFTVADYEEICFENWFFQFAFACALSSIVAGTIAERTQMKAYLLYSVFLVGFVYPVVSPCCNVSLCVCAPKTESHSLKTLRVYTGCARLLVHQWMALAVGRRTLVGKWCH